MKTDEELKNTIRYAVLRNNNGYYVIEVSEYKLKYAQRTAADYAEFLLTKEELVNLKEVLDKIDLK